MNPWDDLQTRGPETITAGGGKITAGSRVVLHPRAHRDIWDAALAGKVGIVESIEHDTDGNAHLVVVVEDDPGRDLGMMRMPGHRFFFAADEVEPLVTTRILVAGIGNIFLGDDGFGCAVAERLVARGFPPGVEVVDYGIRGLDLAYAMQGGWDAVVMIDAAPLGESPGTLAVIEPDAETEPTQPDAHGMDPVGVLRLAASLGQPLPPVFLVACQPHAIIDPESGDDLLGTLSSPVAAAVDRAVEIVSELVDQISDTRTKGGADV